MKLESKNISIRGRKCHYLLGGKGGGFPVLLLHGWGSGADRYVKAFADIPDSSFTVAIPDLPGFGESQTPEKPWRVADYVAWTKDFLSVLSWTECILVGHSFGGRLGIYMAAEHPGRIKSLVLYSSAGVTPKQNFKQLIFRFFAAVGKRILTLPILRKYDHLAKKALYKAAGTSDYLNAGDLKETFKLVISEDLTDFLVKIKAPIILLWGTLDDATPFSDAIKIQSIIPSAKLIELKGEGHSVHIDNPRLFAENLIKIINANQN